MMIYADEIARCPELGEVLRAYAAVTQIKRDIRAVCKTDDPGEIKKMIGTSVGGVAITEETHCHARLVDEEYRRLYDRCKALMGQLCGNHS